MTAVIPFISGFHSVPDEAVGGGAGPYVNSVQYFEITFASAAETQTASIDAVDINRAFIVGITCESAGDGGVDTNMCEVELTDATTITATRAFGDTVTVVRGYIVDATEDLVQSVQYASVSWVGSAATVFTAAINAVDTANSIIIDLNAWYDYGSQGDLLGRSRGWWSFNSTTEIELNRLSGSSTQDGLMRCCVVEFNPAAIESIQEIFFNGDAGPGLTLDSAITAVDTTNTVLFHGGATSTDLANIQSHNGFTLVDADTVRCFVGADTDQTSKATLWVVEFKPGVVNSVEQGTISRGAASSATTVLTTSVSMANACLVPIGKTFGLNVSGSIHNSCTGLELTATDTVTVTNGDPVDAQDTMYFQIVEWRV